LRQNQKFAVKAASPLTSAAARNSSTEGEKKKWSAATGNSRNGLTGLPVGVRQAIGSPAASCAAWTPSQASSPFKPGTVSNCQTRSVTAARISAAKFSGPNTRHTLADQPKCGRADSAGAMGCSRSACVTDSDLCAKLRRRTYRWRPLCQAVDKQSYLSLTAQGP
jgi:hypothetical protein